MRYIDQVFTDWVQQHLPATVPEDLRRELGRIDRYGMLRNNVVNRGVAYQDVTIEFWEKEGLFKKKLVHIARSTEEMNVWLYQYICGEIAIRLFADEYEREMRRWRYVPDHSQPREANGVYHDWCREQSPWEFNAFYDARKRRSEIYLTLVRSVVPEEQMEHTILDLQRELNAGYQSPHWAFDREAYRFIEVSDAPLLDHNGRPVPRPEDVLPPATKEE